MKRVIALLMSVCLMCAGAQAALAGQADAATDAATYEHPVLTFNAPGDATLAASETNADSYVQTLTSAESGATIVSGSWPTADEARAYLTALFGEMTDAQANESLTSVDGCAAAWVSFTKEIDGETVAVDAVLITGARAYLFVSVVPQNVYLGYTDLGVYADVVAEWVNSLEIFDPTARLYLTYESEADSITYTLAGEAVRDAAAAPFLVYAMDSLTNVSLVNVSYDESGAPTLGEALGSWETLAFGQAVRVTAELPDGQPNLAVVYTDAEGVQTTRYITSSGVDGTLMLISG